MVKKNSQSKVFYFTLLCLLTMFLPEMAFAQNKQKVHSNNQPFIHIPRTQHTVFSVGCIEEEFRTIDGTCNNSSHSLKADWGATDIPLFRQIPSKYSNTDSYNAMAGKNRPSARAISNQIVAQGADMPSEANLSSFVFTWGQFLDHDIDLSAEGHTEYEPVILPDNEPLFTYDIPFFRSLVHEDTGIDAPREQTNLITSWIDASNVYGSEESRANWLRTFNNGRLKTSTGNLLPFNTIDGEYNSPIDPEAPSMAGDEEGTIVTYVAGDVRAAEQPGLTSLHTLFVREHNRICEQLIGQGLQDDELIYQKARKQVGALIQAITYREFLPALGVDLGSYNGYKPQVRADISNVFATAAYRLGHTMVTEELLLRDDNCDAVAGGTVSLIDGFFNPTVLYENNIDPILKGLSMQVQQEVDVHIIDNLRNFLFADPSIPGVFGLDLASLNIQRGRDHGLPDYASIRQAYLGQPLQSFNHITNDETTRMALRNAYNNKLQQIDPWVGMLAENKLPGKSVGTTLHAILKKQFEQLRDGDFYYYEHDKWLSSSQKQQIRNTKLSDIILRNTDLTNLDENVFVANSCNAEPPGNNGNGHHGNGHGNNGSGNGNPRSNDGSTTMDETIDFTFILSPNPTDGYFQITYREEGLENLSIHIYSMRGKLIWKEVVKGLAGQFGQSIDLSNVPTGVYHVNLRSDQQNVTQRVVIEK